MGSIIRERTMVGLAAARARGRISGRSPALTDRDIAAAKALLADPNISTKDIAKRLNVSVSTLYRHMPAARATINHEEGAQSPKLRNCS
jgi:DNA invertase Pin-like site-specific DNA recombinase